jgi:hypothetical protein
MMLRKYQKTAGKSRAKEISLASRILKTYLSLAVKDAELIFLDRLDSNDCLPILTNGLRAGLT